MISSYAVVAEMLHRYGFEPSKYPKVDMLCETEGEAACASSQESLLVPYHDPLPRDPSGTSSYGTDNNGLYDIEYTSNQHSFLNEAEVLAMLQEHGVIRWIRNTQL